MKYNFKVLIFILFIVTALSGGCAHIDLDKVQKTPSLILENPEVTTLGLQFAPAANRHAGKSGFMLLDRGEEAIVWRGVLADVAEHTIDAQYFIWEEDTTGTIAAEYLLRAASRGVRVRVLIDDFSIDTEPRYLALLNAHPNIEIRIYNPVKDISASAMRILLSAMYDFKRFNQRMHNKAYIVDGSISIVGGRNIADEYYDMSPKYNYRDRDVLMIGPIVNNVSRGFDAYWNSKWAVPVNVLIKQSISEQDKKEYYTALHAYVVNAENYPDRFHDLIATGKKDLLVLPDNMTWAEAMLINDIPGKNDDPEKLDAFGRSGEQLTKMAVQVQRELLIQTPYLILMPGTFSVIKDLIARGVDIRIQTNSLASTDNLPAFSGYARQREKILKLGVKIHEQKISPESRQHLIKRYKMLNDDAIFAVHAKTAVFDRETVFIGTFNLDPRSTHLNTEMGLVIKSTEFAEKVARSIEHDMELENSWRLSLDKNNNLSWLSEYNGKEVRYTKDPNAGILKKIKLFFFSIMPIEKLL
ncbi:MAG: phospholipase D family protein [Gammaproteobacteria bacterium]|nr:phospholipase D family protein [Gammaproteobacteria bacterium]